MNGTTPVPLSRASLDVSRETHAKLEAYAALLIKWTKRINLISKASAADIWQRHILDSAQLWPLGPVGAQHWADLGAGGGLPGVVLAILALDEAPDLRFTLVESDLRKSVFLQTAARDLDLPSLRVETARIEDLAPLSADVISARALAPLAVLLGWAEHHRAPGALCLFPKGRTHAEELTEARRFWHVKADACPSRTDPAGAILRIGEFSRA